MWVVGKACNGAGGGVAGSATVAVQLGPVPEGLPTGGNGRGGGRKGLIGGKNYIYFSGGPCSSMGNLLMRSEPDPLCIRGTTTTQQSGETSEG